MDGARGSAAAGFVCVHAPRGPAQRPGRQRGASTVGSPTCGSSTCHLDESKPLRRVQEGNSCKEGKAPVQRVGLMAVALEGRSPIAVDQPVAQCSCYLTSAALWQHPLALLQQLSQLVDGLCTQLRRRRLQLVQRCVPRGHRRTRPMCPCRLAGRQGPPPRTRAPSRSGVGHGQSQE